MRISSTIATVLIAAGLVAPATALDPNADARERATVEAFRSGTKSYLAGDKDEALKALQYAAEQGHTAAAWKLGRMYADGDGVRRDDLKAFEYFRRVANLHADEAPGSPQAPFVANAFVALGGFYLSGIPNTPVRRDPARARDMYQYAASYFGDAEAQYRLARMHLEGVGGERDTRQAVRWLGLAAQKGQHQAQAVLGDMLFRGADVPRQAARGLMWLTLARDGAAAAEDGWIVRLHEQASAQASPEERQLALNFIQQWLKNSR
jgi:hypothetical protein